MSQVHVDKVDEQKSNSNTHETNVDNDRKQFTTIIKDGYSNEGVDNIDEHSMNIGEEPYKDGHKHKSKNSKNSKNSDTPTPPPRLSDPWSSEIEGYVSKVRCNSDKKSSKHGEAGHHFRSLEIRWSLPAALIPALCAPIVTLIRYTVDEEDGKVSAADYMSTFGFILTTIFAGVSSYFRYSYRSAVHHSYSARYMDIVTDIDTELVKRKEFRTSADVFITTIKMKYDSMVFGEPVIPKFIDK